MTDPALSVAGRIFKDGLRDKLEAAKLHRSEVLDKHMTISIRYALDATECEMESSARTLPRPAEGSPFQRISYE